MYTSHDVRTCKRTGHCGCGGFKFERARFAAGEVIPQCLQIMRAARRGKPSPGARPVAWAADTVEEGSDADLTQLRVDGLPRCLVSAAPGIEFRPLVARRSPGNRQYEVRRRNVVFDWRSSGYDLEMRKSLGEQGDASIGNGPDPVHQHTLWARNLRRLTRNNQHAARDEGVGDLDSSRAEHRTRAPEKVVEFREVFGRRADRDRVLVRCQVMPSAVRGRVQLVAG